MYYYATISRYIRKSTNSELQLNGFFQSETELDGNVVSKILLEEQRLKAPDGFTLFQLGYVYKFTKDPQDYFGCIKDFLYGDPNDVADISAFLVEFNQLDRDEMTAFYDFVHSFT